MPSMLFVIRDSPGVEVCGGEGVKGGLEIVRKL
jgi:hypothetical protein